MSLDELEHAYSKSVMRILETIGHTASNYSPLLGGKSLELAIENIESYLAMLIKLKSDYDKPLSNSSVVVMSPNDSVFLHRSRLSRSSKSRLTMMRNSPSVSPMEVSRNGVTAPMILDERQDEEITILDATCEMNDTTNERGFLADVSSLNGTVRSREPSLNFDAISPVFSHTSRFDYEHETSRFSEMLKGSSSCQELNMTREMMQTPQKPEIIEIDVTPNNLWNVKLRSGSNRKISEEIRREVQRQLANS